MNSGSMATRGASGEKPTDSQMNQIALLLGQKHVSRNRLQALLETGLLADLFSADLHHYKCLHSSRELIRRVLGLLPTNGWFSVGLRVIRTVELSVEYQTPTPQIISGICRRLKLTSTEFVPGYSSVPWDTFSNNRHKILKWNGIRGDVRDVSEFDIVSLTDSGFTIPGRNAEHVLLSCGYSLLGDIQELLAYIVSAPDDQVGPTTYNLPKRLVALGSVGQWQGVPCFGLPPGCESGYRVLHFLPRNYHFGTEDQFLVRH